MTTTLKSNKMNKIHIVLIVLLLVSIGVNIWLGIEWHNCKSKDSYNFCGTCQGIVNKVCTNRPLVNKLYNEGVLTENSEFTKPNDPKYNWMQFHEYPNHPQTSSCGASTQENYNGDHICSKCGKIVQ